jgi:hypothetical protein
VDGAGKLVRLVSIRCVCGEGKLVGWVRVRSGWGRDNNFLYYQLFKSITTKFNSPY